MPGLVSRLTRYAVAFALLVPTFAHGGDWPQYRGPNANMAVPAGGYPAELTPSTRVWSVDLPGEGSGAPIVVGDAIFLTSEIDGKDSLSRYDLNGQEVWSKTLGEGRSAKHRSATGANPTPVTDGERVFAYYKSGLLVATTLDGQELWRRNLQEEFAPDTLWWDLGSSPVVTDAGVLVAVMQAGDSYVATFDAATGETVWKVPRVYKTEVESDQAYTTPNLAQTDAGPVAVVFGADHLTGHDISTGETLFTVSGFNPDDQRMWRVIGSPVVIGDAALVTYGRGDHVAAIRLGGSGDTTESAWLWDREGVGADVPSAVVADGRVYVLGDKGAIECLDFQTGKTLWSDRLPRSRAPYFASPLVAGDLIYCHREDGQGVVGRLSNDGLEVVGQIDLGDDSVVTLVPIDGDRILARTRRSMQVFAAE